jgi:hypothetical protein
MRNIFYMIIFETDSAYIYFLEFWGTNLGFNIKSPCIIFRLRSKYFLEFFGATYFFCFCFWHGIGPWASPIQQRKIQPLAINPSFTDKDSCWPKKQHLWWNIQIKSFQFIFFLSTQYKKPSSKNLFLMLTLLSRLIILS